MRNKRRRRKPIRTNQTRNRRALAEPEVQQLAKDLRKGWKQLDRIDRAERLRVLVDHGCSTRGLEREIRQSPTTIRRYLAVTELSEEDRNAVSEGASLKKILQRRDGAKRRKRIQDRVAEDHKSGKYSNELANVILRFCRAESNVPESPLLKGELATFLQSVKQHLGSLRYSRERPPKVGSKNTWKQLLEQTRPLENKEDFWLERRSKWLANLLWTKEQEGKILDAGLKKAQFRSAELDPPRSSPLDQYYDSAVRRKMISATPRRRKY